MNFRCCVKVLTFLNVSKSPKQFAIFGSILLFYIIRAVTILIMVDYGSPRLCITKNSLVFLSVRQGIGAICWDIKSKCMSADSWYSGLALSVRIRSKAQTFYDLWQFKVLHNNFFENITEEDKIIFSSVLNFRRVTLFWLRMLKTQVVLCRFFDTLKSKRYLREFYECCFNNPSGELKFFVHTPGRWNH